MTSRTTLSVALVIAGAFLYLGVCNAQGGKVNADAPPEIKAQEFLNTDTPPKLADLKGKTPVLVEFWATWCPPCRRSIPHLNDLQAKYEGDLVIVGLTDEDRATVEEFQEKVEMRYAVGVGSSSGRDYGVRTIPRAFLIGIDGSIVWQGNPLEPGLDAAIEKAVEEARAKRG